METILKFTVDRKRWLRGEGENRSALLRPEDNKMCCLGFACLAAGHTEDEIRGVTTPYALTKNRGMRCLLPNYNTGQIGSAMDANDRPAGAGDDLRRAHPEAVASALARFEHASKRPVAAPSNNEFTEAKREAYITELLAEIGIEVTFEG